MVQTSDSLAGRPPVPLPSPSPSPSAADASAETGDPVPDEGRVFRGTPEREAARRAHEAELAAPRSVSTIAADELRALCLELGAGDAGFVEVDRPSLADELAPARRLFPDARTYVALVRTTNPDAVRSESRAVANIAWKANHESLDHVAATLIERLGERGIRGVVTSIGFPMDPPHEPGARPWELAHKPIAVEAGMGHMGLNRNVIHPRNPAKRVRYLDYRPSLSTAANFALGLRHQFDPARAATATVTVRFSLPDGVVDVRIADGRIEATVVEGRADGTSTPLDAVVLVDATDYIGLLHGRAVETGGGFGGAERLSVKSAQFRVVLAPAGQGRRTKAPLFAGGEDEDAARRDVQDVLERA